MVSVTPAGITPGAASDGSVVHASDAALGNLSRAHDERDISRLQSAILPYDATKTYLVGDIATEGNLNWVCDVAVPVPEAFDIGNWKLISDAFAVLIQSYETDVAVDGTFYAVQGGTIGHATEADAQAPFPLAITLRLFTLSVISNTLVNPFTWVVRKNGADGNGIITIGTGLTGTFQDTVNVDSFVSGDLVDYVYREGGGTGAATLIGSSCITLRPEV